MATAQSTRSTWHVVVTLAMVLLPGLLPALVPAAAYAQDGSTAILGEGGPRTPHRGGRNQKGGTPANTDENVPKLAPQPLQRLDAGALLCKTENQLLQHESAVAARLDGQDAPEPVGCHLVQTMTAVAVVDRHGQNRTEVKAGDQLGWTDSIVRNP